MAMTWVANKYEHPRNNIWVCGNDDTPLCGTLTEREGGVMVDVEVYQTHPACVWNAMNEGGMLYPVEIATIPRRDVDTFLRIRGIELL